MNDAATKVIESVSTTGLVNLALILFLSVRLLAGELGLAGAVKLKWSIDVGISLLLAAFILLTVYQLAEVLR